MNFGTPGPQFPIAPRRRASDHRGKSPILSNKARGKRNPHSSHTDRNDLGQVRLGLDWDHPGHRSWSIDTSPIWNTHWAPRIQLKWCICHPAVPFVCNGEGRKLAVQPRVLARPTWSTPPRPSPPQQRAQTSELGRDDHSSSTTLEYQDGPSLLRDDFSLFSAEMSSVQMAMRFVTHSHTHSFLHSDTDKH